MPATRLSELRGGQDPIITSIVEGYSNEGFISDQLLPTCPVTKPIGKFIDFGSDAMVPRSGDRALKQTEIDKVDLDRYTLKDYSCNNKALATVIDHEEIEAASDIIKLDDYYANILMESLSLGKEYDRCQLLQNPASYASGNATALSGTSRWSDDTSDPIEQIKDAMEVVRLKILKLPNTVAISRDVWKCLTNHPKVLERLKYNQFGLVTEDIVSQLLSEKTNPVKILIGSGLRKDPDTGTFYDLWSNSVVMAYVTQTAKAQRSKYERTFGYSFQLSGYPYGNKVEGDRHGKTTEIAVFNRYDDKIINNAGGYLFTSVVS